MNCASNTVIVTGNLTREPEVKFQLAGQAKLVLIVAAHCRQRDPGGPDRQDATTLLEVVCWGDLALNVSQSARRGDRVVVTGRVEQRTWRAKGVFRSKTEVVADDVALSLRWATATACRAATGVDDHCRGGHDRDEAPEPWPATDDEWARR